MRGRWVCGQAFRDQRVIVSNDFLNDERSLAWRKGACEANVAAAAALPLTCNGRTVGVLLVTHREVGSLNERVVSLLENMSANISYALNNFDREQKRRDAERAMKRISRMFEALSATNEAIMRAKCRKQLFELVCEAVANGAKFTSTTIGLVRAGDDFLDIVASAGPTAGTTRNARLSTSPDRPEGSGIVGTAFRSRAPCISNDYLADPRGVSFHVQIQRDGAKSAAAFPLLSLGQPIGILLLISSERDTFTPELVELLLRLAENVSFALGSFDRADEKAAADRQKERPVADVRGAQRHQ